MAAAAAASGSVREPANTQRRAAYRVEGAQLSAPAWMDEHYYDVPMPDAASEAASFNSYKDLYADFKQTSVF